MKQTETSMQGQQCSTRGDVKSCITSSTSSVQVWIEHVAFVQPAILLITHFQVREMQIACQQQQLTHNIYHLIVVFHVNLR